MRNTRLYILLALIVAMLVPAAGMRAMGTARAAGPTISVSPNGVVAGTNSSITVTGSGFTANGMVTLRLDNGATAGTQANAAGTISQPIVISVPVGQHTLTAIDNTTNLSASQTFYVVNLNLSATSASAGTQVTINGQGFPASQPLTVTLGGQSVVSNASTDASGNFSQPFTVPASLGAGQQQLIVQVQNGSNPTVVVDSTFTVTAAQAHISLDPSTVNAGGSFSISGTGLPANATLTLKLVSTTISIQVTTDGNGAFGPISFTVPAGTPNGSYSIAAVDAKGNTLATGTLTVNAQAAALSLSPNSGAPGMQVAATGTGFQAGEPVQLTVNNGSATQTTANGQGQINVTITLPRNLSAGTVTIQAAGQTSHQTASASFTIAAASVTLNPANGSGGTKVTVNGSNFAAGEAVSISFAGAQVAAALAGTNGAFSASFNVPSGHPGPKTVTATGTTSHISASTTFTETGVQITAGSNSVRASSQVRLNGNGFAANEQVLITIPGHTLATTNANTVGSFSVNVTIPAGQAVGSLTITATGQSSHLAATATIIVTAAPRIALSRATVPAGSGITINGTNFGPNEQVLITIPGRTLATANANAQGSFLVNVTIPASQALGNLTITAAGQSSHLSVMATVEVVAAARITLNTATIQAGSAVTIAGTGFGPNEPVTLTIPGFIVPGVVANAQGSFSTSFTIPATANAASLKITATGQQTRRTATATLTVVPRVAAGITVSPSTFAPGTQVRISGSGFAPAEQVALSVNGGAPFATAVTGSHGNFVLTITLPATLPTGSVRITAAGQTSHISAATTVQISVPSSITVGSSTWYFAAGRTDSGISTQIAVLNPNAGTVQGTITLYYGTNQTRVYPFSLRPKARGTYDLGRILGYGTRVAASVQANLPIAVARTTQRGEMDRMATTGVSAPSRTWYMAEGYTGLTFQEELDLLNPGSQIAHVHIVWPLFNGRAPIVHDVALAPRSHQTISVNAYVNRASHATAITSDQPIVASRTILFGTLHQGADSKAGAKEGSTLQYFAEGSTNNGFQEFLTILNPDTTRQAQVTATFYDRQGRLLGRRAIAIDPMHRGNITVNDVVHNTAIATVLSSNIPVVAERAMYFGSPNSGSAGGTVVFGQPTPAMGWAFATGDSNPGHSEFELLFNPNAAGSTIQASYYADNGQVVQRVFTLPGHTRLNIDLNLSVPGLPHGYHGVILRSLNGVSFLAEQAIYSNNMSNGSATIGTPAR